MIVDKIQKTPKSSEIPKAIELDERSIKIPKERHITQEKDKKLLINSD